MRICRTKGTRLIPALLACLLLAIVLSAIMAVPLVAQSAPESHPFYDITKEVSLTGTVSSVLAKPAEGMLFGSHLMLETNSGQVDASESDGGACGSTAGRHGQHLRQVQGLPDVGHAHGPHPLGDGTLTGRQHI